MLDQMTSKIVWEARVGLTFVVPIRSGSLDPYPCHVSLRLAQTHCFFC